MIFLALCTDWSSPASLGVVTVPDSVRRRTPHCQSPWPWRPERSSPAATAAAAAARRARANERTDPFATRYA